MPLFFGRLKTNGLAIDEHLVALRIDQHWGLPDFLSIHMDSAFQKHPLDIPPRINAGVGEDFLDSLSHWG